VLTNTILSVFLYSMPYKF